MEARIVQISPDLDDDDEALLDLIKNGHHKRSSRNTEGAPVEITEKAIIKALRRFGWIFLASAIFLGLTISLLALVMYLTAHP